MELLKTFKFLTIVLAAFFAFLYLATVFYVYFNQVGMVFQSVKLAEDYQFEYQSKFEELTIRSFDGVKLNGLLFKASNTKGLIFYLHGNAGTLETWGSISKRYTDLGYDIFILDYRSFGKSEGEIEDEEQLNKDISIVYKNLCLRYSENTIIIAGYSIGSGLATILAAENKPKALILQAPYYSFRELSSTKVRFFPDFLKKFSFETHDFLPKIKAPIYIFHGSEDLLIPIENSIRLSKLLKPTDHFYCLEGQGHVGMNENEGFLKQLQIVLK